VAEPAGTDRVTLLTGIVAELLGPDAPAEGDVADADLLDLGIDSLMLFRIRARVAQLTGVALGVPALFSAGTLRELAAAIDEAAS
jgi:aryl carrier-like protein